ncbi:uncharacterized protein [Miscanthus floridulus]|uniref:uncharacterized protein n=1 Tax=Miscanthus floridulus TaxID=154761 RepID=UPI003458CFF1
MDGGSMLNILYAEIPNKMKIPRSSLCSSGASFFEVVPGKEALPLGRIRLHVTFSKLDNFCKESLTIKVVDFSGMYHALLKRPCFTTFMVVTNYTYLKLKMLGHKGVITISANFQ